MRTIYLLLFVIVLSVGCKREKCGEIVCRNGGECENGKCDCKDEYFGDECEVRCHNGADWDGEDCICAEGYEGEDCSQLVRDRFVGSYEMDGYCDCGGSSPVFLNPFVINVTAGSDDLAINISLLDVDVALPIEAFISGQTFEIPAQSFNGNITISGGGEFGQTFLYIAYGKIVGTGASTYTETYRLVGSPI